MRETRWGVYEMETVGEVHVAPVVDVEAHAFDVLCMCNPRIEIGERLIGGEPYFLIIHEELC
jgi:hypothetical protein